MDSAIGWRRLRKRGSHADGSAHEMPPLQKSLRGRNPASFPSACGAETPHCLPEQILVFAFAEVLVGFGGELTSLLALTLLIDGYWSHGPDFLANIC